MSHVHDMEVERQCEEYLKRDGEIQKVRENKKIV